MTETYLGDGVYASLGEGMIKLRTTRDEGDHVIYLDWSVYAALISFARVQGWEEP